MRRRKLRWSLLFAVSACTGITSGSTPVSLEWVSPVPPSIGVDSTAILRVLARDRAGAIVTVPISLMSLQPQYLAVDSSLGAHDSTLWFRVKGVSLDSLGHPVNAQVVATTGNLQSIPLTITVDSI